MANTNGAAVWISVLPDMSKFGSQMSAGVSKSADSAGKSLGSRMASGMGKTLKVGAATAAAGAAAAIGTSLYKGFSRLQGIDQAEAKLRGLGHSAKGVQGIMDNALASVKGTAFGLDAAATTAAGAVAAGIKPGQQLERTLKLVGDTATIAGVGMDEMGAIFNKVASSDMIQGDVLAQLGDKGIPVLQMLAKEMGVSATEVRKLASAGQIDFKTFQNAMEAGLGGAAQESGKTFSGAMANTQAAMGRLGAVVLGPIFKRIPGILEGMMVRIDALGPVAEKIGTTLGAAFAWAGEAISTHVMPRLKEFGGFLLNDVWPVIKSVGQWMKENVTTLKVLAGVIGLATAAYVIYSTTVRIVTATTAAWAAVQKILNTSLKLNPIGMVVTAIALLAAGLVIAYKKSDTFREVVDRAWAGIKTAIKTAWEGYIRPALRAFYGFVQEYVIPVMRALWNDVIKPVFRQIGSFLKGTWNNVIQPVLKLWWAYITNVLIPVLKMLWEKVVRPVFKLVGEVIKTTWQNVIRPVFAALRDFIVDKVAPGFRKGVEAISKAWQKLKDAAKGPVNFVIGTVYNNGIRKVFNSIAEKLGSDMRLPAGRLVGGGGIPASPGTPGGGIPIGGASRIPARYLGEAMGGPVDWAKNVIGKGSKWVTGRMSGMVDGLLGDLGSSPWAQVAGDAARKVAGMAVDFLGPKADEAKAAAAQKGKMGKAGRVLPSGSYRIGMPYLGYSGHYGADYPAGIGTPVFSPWAGRVTASYDLPGSNRYNSTPYRSYGRVVKITHDNGLSTLYAHLDQRLASVGPVKAGQQIGTVGTNGNSTGPHLHFEAARNGATFNPATLGIFDSGGWLKPGMAGVNLSTKPEPVFTGGQWDILKGAIGGKGDGKNGKRKGEITDLNALYAAMFESFDFAAGMSLSEMNSEIKEFRQAVKAAGGTWGKEMKALAGEARALVKMHAAQAAALEQSTARLSELKEASAAFAQQVGQTFNSNIFGNGLAGLGLGLSADTNDSNAMRAALEVLANDLGLDGPLFEALAASGDLSTAQALAGLTAEQIDAYERMYADRIAAQNALGQYAADEVYAEAIARQERIVKDQEATLRALAGAMENIEARMEQGVQQGAKAGVAEGLEKKRRRDSAKARA